MSSTVVDLHDDLPAVHDINPFFLVTPQYPAHVPSGHNGIRDNGDPVAPLQRSQGCVVDTEGGIQADKEDLVNLVINQELLQLPVRKGIRPVLGKIVFVDNPDPAAEARLHPAGEDTSTMESRDEIAGEYLPDIGYFQAGTIEAFYQVINGLNHPPERSGNRKVSGYIPFAVAALLDIHHQQGSGRIGIAGDPFTSRREVHIPEDIQCKQQGKAGSDGQDNGKPG